MEPSRTQTHLEAGPNNRSPLYEDQIRDYRRNQRRAYNAQHALRRISRRINGSSNYQRTLEQQIDPQAQLQLSMRERASLVPAEVLYHSRRDDMHHRVYTHRSEEAILCVDNQQVDRTFIQPQSYESLR